MGVKNRKALCPKGFKSSFLTPLYIVCLHTTTQYIDYLHPILFHTSITYIHLSHISLSFGFGAPHIIHTSLLRISYLHTISVITDGIGDKSSSPSYQLSIHHFSFASATWYLATSSFGSACLISLHISNIKSCQPTGSASNNVSGSLPISSHGYSAISSLFLYRPI